MFVMLAAADTPLLANPEFWVAMAFVVFAAMMLYYNIPGLIARSLDSRADRIRSELDEARRLREEAQALLADYQRRAAKAEDEAREIVERAQQDAKAYAADARQALKESLERRTRMAEEKISRAETEAVSEVRNAAVDQAVRVTETVLKSRGGQSAQIDEAIQTLPSRLN